MGSNLLRAMIPGKVAVLNLLIWALSVTFVFKKSTKEQKWHFIKSSGLTKRNYKEPMCDEDYELIEHPRLELHLHVATKFVQVSTHELNVCVILGSG